MGNFFLNNKKLLLQTSEKLGTIQTNYIGLLTQFFQFTFANSLERTKSVSGTLASVFKFLSVVRQSLCLLFWDLGR